MSVQEYIDPQTGKVWCKITDDRVQIFIGDERMLKTLCGWKCPPGAFKIIFVAFPDREHHIWGFIGIILKADPPPCKIDLYLANQYTIWRKGFMDTMHLLIEYVTREHAVNT